MKKQSVLFVCLGNICRSPAAEAIFLDLINKKGLNDCFIVDSAGTGSWHIGKRADNRMRIASQKRGVEILSRARQINVNDFDDFFHVLVTPLEEWGQFYTFSICFFFLSRAF